MSDDDLLAAITPIVEAGATDVDAIEILAGASVRARGLLAADGARLSTSRVDEPAWCAVRVWVDGKLGVAGDDVTRLDAAALAPFIATARARARTGPASTPPAALDAPASTTTHAAAPTADAVEATRTRVRALGAPVQTFLHTRVDDTLALASSTGRRAAWRRRREDLLVRLEAPLGAVVDGARLADAPDAEAAALGDRLALALDALDAPGDAPPAGVPWLLRPAVAGPLAEGLAWLLGGHAALATPGLLRAVGKQVFPSCLTVVDAPPSGFDDEGAPLVTHDLVRAGKLVAFLADDATAHALRAAGVADARPGRASRGLALEPQPAPFGLAIAAGTSRPPERFIELAGRVEMFATMPRANLVTVRACGWLVEGGVRVRRVGPIDLDLPLLATLRRLAGVGDDLARLPALGPVATPSLILAAERTP